MTRRLFAACAVIASSVLLGACSDTTGGKSTSTDSSNQNGIAPVQYSEGTPSTTIDTTAAARDQYSRDTLGQRAGRTQPNGDGSNTSNTMDARTNSGSANNGDADRDKKQ